LGAISNDITDISVYFYDLPESHKRRNKLVYPSGKLSNTQLISLPKLFEATGFKAKAGSYLQWRKFPLEPHRRPFIDCLTAEHKSTSLVTSYVVADFDTEDGLDLLREAVESLVCRSVTVILTARNANRVLRNQVPRLESPSCIIQPT